MSKMSNNEKKAQKRKNEFKSFAEVQSTDEAYDNKSEFKQNHILNNKLYNPNKSVFYENQASSKAESQINGNDRNKYQSLNDFTPLKRNIKVVDNDIFSNNFNLKKLSQASKVHDSSSGQKHKSLNLKYAKNK